MAPPVIATVTSPVSVGTQARLTGVEFGFVSGVAIINTVTDEVINCQDFIVDTGASIRFTVPRFTPAAFYEVELATIFNEISTNNAGTLNVILELAPLPPEPAFPEAGTTIERVRERIRYEMGDCVESFSASLPGDGSSTVFDLPVGAVSATGLSVEVVAANGTVQQLLSPADYTIDAHPGVITLVDPTPAGSTLRVGGVNAQFFMDDELDMFIESAFLKHGHNATVRTMTRNPVTGRVLYTTDAQSLANLPAVEEHPIALLAAIEALWVLAADASYDIDVVTAEGTSLPRSERHRAIMSMITAQQERYKDLAQQLGIGLSRIEMFTLRRVSLTTGRLVPVYQSREYDEQDPPTRVFPPVDTGRTGNASQKRVYIGTQYPPGP